MRKIILLVIVLFSITSYGQRLRGNVDFRSVADMKNSLYEHQDNDIVSLVIGDEIELYNYEPTGVADEVDSYALTNMPGRWVKYVGGDSSCNEDDVFFATAGQTVFNLSVSALNLFVIKNKIIQDNPSDFTFSGTVLTFTTPLDAGDKVIAYIDCVPTSGGSGSTVTNTSDITNDGADGTNPFITANDLTALNTIYWNTNGNIGTDDATNFLGTTDVQDLVFKVNNVQIGRFFEDINGIGLGTSFTVSGLYGTVGGGLRGKAIGNFSTVDGGTDNTANGFYSSIDGGRLNITSGSYSNIDGGFRNEAIGNSSSVGGGQDNKANKQYSIVGGGLRNIADGNISTVSGGTDNTAPSYAEWVGGAYGTFYTPISSTSWQAKDRAFNLGVGNLRTLSRDDAFTVLKDATTGIGYNNFESTISNSLLQVNGDIESNGNMLSNAFLITSDTRLKYDFVQLNLFKVINGSQIPVYQYKRTYNGQVETGLKAQDVLIALNGLSENEKNTIIKKTKGIDYNATLLAMNTAYNTNANNIQEIYVVGLNKAVEIDLQNNGFINLTRAQAISEYQNLLSTSSLTENEEERLSRFKLIDFSGMKIHKTFNVEINDLLLINTTVLNWYEEENTNTNNQNYVPRLIVQDNVYATVGYTRQFFYESIIECLDYKQYNIKITGTINGNQYPDYYEFTPTNSGTYTFIISIYDNNNNLVNTNSCNIIVSDLAVSPTSNKNILLTGDSLAASGEVLSEMYRMLTSTGGTPIGLGLNNITTIGTTNKLGVNYEAYGGKTWNWFINETDVSNADVRYETSVHGKGNDDLTSIYEDDITGDQWKIETIGNGARLYMSRVGHANNPPLSGTMSHISGGVNLSTITYNSWSGGATNNYWSESTDSLNFQNYISENSISGEVDLSISQLTWNNMSGNRSNPEDHSYLLADARTFLDQLKSDYPNVKHIVNGIPLPSKNGGLGNNYGDADSNYGNYEDLKRTVNGLNLAYQQLANEPAYSSWVTFVNISMQFDNLNNMPQSLKPVNTRNITQVYQGTNGVHPNQSGYYQIADADFHVINYLLQ